MEFQRAEILRHLSQFGWDVINVEDHRLEWWADEVWRLESSWSPIGTHARVTFLVDPQASSNRKKGQQVWAVKASVARPTDWPNSADEFTLSLGHGWKGQLGRLMEHLSKLRHKSQG